jgi:hypothetical protein
MSDYRHRQNVEEVQRYQAAGFRFEITQDGYSVHFRDKFLGGASVMLPRETPLRGRQGEANRRGHLESALVTVRAFLR